MESSRKQEWCWWTCGTLGAAAGRSEREEQGADE